MSFTSLSELRKSRGNLENLQKEVEKLANPYKNENEGYWAATLDKAGNSSATLRFLPAPKGEDNPWVMLYTHGFKGPTGKWYIENSRTTLKESDPVAEANSLLWNEGSEASKQTARERKRRLSYISNVLVIKDPGNPDNEGKVFLYKYGKKIFDKLADRMNPQFADEEASNPFDFWSGSNFKLRIRKVEGYNNYDKSELDSPSAISETDDEIEAIWVQEKSLTEIVDPKNFKSYDELAKKLNAVLNGTGVATAENMAKMRDVASEDAPTGRAVAPKASKSVTIADDDEDDSIAYFASLAND
jgi:hypothetical protein